MKYYNILLTVIAVVAVIAASYIFFFVEEEKPVKVAIVPEGYLSIEEYVLEKTEEAFLGADTVLPAGLFTYRLSGAGISSSATSFTLTSLTLPQNDYAIQDSDLSNTFYLTLEPGSKTKQEFVSCTTVGSNTGSSVTISGCTRGLSPVTPFTASSTLQFPHSGASAVIFSDPPNLFNEYSAKGNDETITGVWSFTDQIPSITQTATTSLQAANKAYVDSVTNAGAATSTTSNGGIVELALNTEAGSSTPLTAAQPLVLTTDYATTTPEDNCGTLTTCVAMTIGQYLKQSFINLTEAFSWTGPHTFSTSNLTITASTSIRAATSTPLTLNSIDYQFPYTSNTASSSILASDGSNDWYQVSQDWAQLGQTVLTGATSTIDVSFAAREELRIVLHITDMDGASGEIDMHFNGDESASAYSSRYPNNASGTSNAKTTAARISHATSTASQFIDMRVTNRASSFKVGWGKVVAVNETTGDLALNANDNFFTWDDATNQITSINILANNPQDFSAGTRLTVYGKRD